MSVQLPIQVDQEAIAEFCRKHHITKLAFFGSVLRDDFNENSDIDVLVEFDPDSSPTLFDIIEMEYELSDRFGRKVDIRTIEDLSRHFRDTVRQSAVVLYDAA